MWLLCFFFCFVSFCRVLFLYIFFRDHVFYFVQFSAHHYQIEKDTTSSFRHLVKNSFNPLESIQFLLVILPVSVLSLEEWSPFLCTCLFVFLCFNLQDLYLMRAARSCRDVSF